MEKIIVLGTGTASVTNNFNTCFILENDSQEYLLVDTGGGNQILKQLKLANININNIHNVFISHKHDELDDVSDIIGFLEKNYNISGKNK